MINLRTDFVGKHDTRKQRQRIPYVQVKYNLKNDDTTTHKMMIGVRIYH